MYATVNYCCNMEDKVEIFVKGAKKIAKIKRYTQGDIAEGIKNDVPELKGSQGTISSYFIGRTRPKDNTMIAIAKFLQTPYEEILEAGRQVTQLGAEDVKQIVAGEMNKYSSSVPTTNLEEYKTQKNHLHHDKIDEFKEQDRALRINSILVEIEKSDFDVLDKIEKMVQLEFDVLKKKELINSLLWNRF